jgi:pyruvate carboxylase
MGPMMLKAAAGGGGRGMRPVRDAETVEAAFATCAREAQAAFGDGTLYAEQLMEDARHIEVQIAGDGTQVVAIGDRDCSLQRRRQKLVEIAPAPNLSDAVRAALFDAAVRLTAGYRTLATVEFLVGSDGRFAFIEVNARLQVEHTVTEEVTGLDLVRAQFELAGGASLAEIGLTTTPHAQGYAIQGRVNLETLSADGTPQPSTGTITTYAPPGGPGVRVDGMGAAGLVVTGAYDSLLAKVIGRGRTASEAAGRRPGPGRIPDRGRRHHDPPAARPAGRAGDRGRDGDHRLHRP